VAADCRGIGRLLAEESFGLHEAMATGKLSSRFPLTMSGLFISIGVWGSSTLESPGSNVRLAGKFHDEFYLEKLL
jgi:hypothetical protein